MPTPRPCAGALRARQRAPRGRRPKWGRPHRLGVRARPRRQGQRIRNAVALLRAPRAGAGGGGVSAARLRIGRALRASPLPGAVVRALRKVGHALRLGQAQADSRGGPVEAVGGAPGGRRADAGAAYVVLGTPLPPPIVVYTSISRGCP